MNAFELAASHDNYELTKDFFLRVYKARRPPEWGQSLLENPARFGSNIKTIQFLLQYLHHFIKIEGVIVAAAEN